MVSSAQFVWRHIWVLRLINALEKNPQTLLSCIYQGWVRHRRLTPHSHEFCYNVFMLYVDLEEIGSLLTISRLLSPSRFSPLRFVRSDFHGPAHLSISAAIIATVKAATGNCPQGRIMMLANWRLFGVNLNPLTTYYCFDQTNTYVEYVVAEVNNTPWDQRHSYVLTCVPKRAKQQLEFVKMFHVSPFNPLHMQYRWVSTQPDKTLLIHIENWRQEQKIMDATLQLSRLEFTAENLRKTLIRFPWMTVKVVLAIYWQAFKLWSKKIPYYPHAKKNIIQGEN